MVTRSTPGETATEATAKAIAKAVDESFDVYISYSSPISSLGD